MKLAKQLHSHKALITSLGVGAAVALASSVTLPNTFTAGTTARAAEVNANFSAVKTAVDDNHARITALERTPAYTTPQLSMGWDNVGGSFMVSGYTKDAMGFVHLRGILRRSSGTATTLFTLPVGFRPSAILQFPSRCGNDALCYVQINANGAVDWGGPATANPGTSLTLDGIVFDAR